MLNCERLEEILTSAFKPARVTIELEHGRLIATVISPEFEGLEESVRQARVWELLLEKLSGEESAQVEFVFTSTEEEAKQSNA